MGALSSYGFTPGEFAVASVNLALPPSGAGRCRPHSTLKLPVTGHLGVHGQRGQCGPLGWGSGSPLSLPWGHEANGSHAVTAASGLTRWT